MVKILEGRLRHDSRSGRTPLEDSIADRLTRTSHQGDAEVSTRRFELREALTHRPVPAEKTGKHEICVTQGLAHKSREGIFVLDQNERI